MKERDFDDDGFIDTLEEWRDNMLENEGFLNRDQKKLLYQIEDMIDAEKKRSAIYISPKGTLCSYTSITKARMPKETFQKNG